MLLPAGKWQLWGLFWQVFGELSGRVLRVRVPLGAELRHAFWEARSDRLLLEPGLDGCCGERGCARTQRGVI